MKNILPAHLALLSLNLIYAANHLLAKGVTPDYLGPNGFIIFRMGITTVVFLFIYLIFIKEKVAKNDLPLLAITGVFGVGLSQLLFFNGIALTSAMNVGVLMTSVPIFVVILSYFILKEKITKLKALGVIIGGIGALALTTAGKQPEFDSTLGDILILLNALIFSIYLVLVKPLMAKYRPLTVITYNFIFGLLFIVLYPKVWTDVAVAQFDLFPTEAWLKIGFIVIFATIFTYLLNVFALKYLAPSVAGSYVYTQPAFVIILTFVFAYIGWTEDFSGALTLEKILFMLMIFSGVFLISRSSLNERKKRARMAQK